VARNFDLHRITVLKDEAGAVLGPDGQAVVGR